MEKEQAKLTLKERLLNYLRNGQPSDPEEDADNILALLSAEGEKLPLVKTFKMYRHSDLSATHDKNQVNKSDEVQFEGVVFSDGKVAIRWLTACRSVSVWDCFEDMMKIYGHPEYGSELVWDADQPYVNALRANNQDWISRNRELNSDVVKLRAQLAEKDEEIERLKGQILTNKQADWLLNNVSWCAGCHIGKNKRPNCSINGNCPLQGLAELLVTKRISRPSQ